jgi:hypothetical protein
MAAWAVGGGTSEQLVGAEAQRLGARVSSGEVGLEQARVHARECKGKLPLSVFLVINDNPYGLMFSLSFL